MRKHNTAKMIRYRSVFFQLTNANIRCVSTQSKDKISEHYPANWNDAQPYESIPGPKPLPIIGNKWRLAFGRYSTQKQSYSELYNRLHEDYGEIVALRNIQPIPDFVFINNPEDVEKMLRNEGLYPLKKDIFKSLYLYRHKIRTDKYAKTGGVLTTDGKQWHEARQVINILLEPRLTDYYCNELNLISDQFLEVMEKLRTENSKGEMPANFINYIFRWAFESIGWVAVNKRFGSLNHIPNEEAELLIHNAVKTMRLMGKLDYGGFIDLHMKLNTPIWKQLVKMQDDFTSLVNKIVEDKEAEIKSDPNYKLKSREEKSAFELFLDVNKDIALVTTLDVFFGGADTTGNTVAAILYYLAKNPRAQDKLREELLKHDIKKDKVLAHKTLSQISYLNAVVEESLRLTPIIEAVWRASNNIVIKNYRIPKGVVVISETLNMSKSETNFPRAMEFIPERWLRSTSDEGLNRKMIKPFTSLPFGFGPRSCPGKRIAKAEINIVIAKIVTTYKLHWDHPDMKFKQEFMYGIADPLKIRLEPVNGEM